MLLIIAESGRMPSPLVTFLNRTIARVDWGHNFHAGGPIHHFDINITHQLLGESKLLKTNGSEVHSMVLNLATIAENEEWVPDCVNESLTTLYNVTVRAVTVDPETNTLYYGAWSPPEVTPAYCSCKYIHYVSR